VLEGEAQDATPEGQECPMGTTDPAWMVAVEAAVKAAVEEAHTTGEH
jgi:hypothetical protein